MSRNNWGASLDPQLARLIEQDFVSAAPRKPVRLPDFASTDLPAPADWRGSLIYVPDKSCAAVSTGAVWVRADGSAL